MRLTADGERVERQLAMTAEDDQHAQLAALFDSADG